MNCDEDPIEVYFCPPLKMNKEEEPGKTETGHINPDLEYPSSKRTSLTEEVEDKSKVITSDGGIEVYFCPPLKIKKEESPGENETIVAESDSESSSPSSRRTSVAKEIDEKDEPYPYETDTDEHDSAWSPPCPRDSSMTGEYVLSKSNRENDEVDVHAEIEQPPQQRQAIQDVYDEDHYCLARLSNNDADTFRDAQEEDDEKKRINHSFGNFFSMKKTKIICFLGIFFVSGIFGGVVAYFSLGEKGNQN